jgi:hypothetical protein
VALSLHLCGDPGGFVYVAFVIDADARRIAGWLASRTGHAGFVLDTLEETLHDRRVSKSAFTRAHSRIDGTQVDSVEVHTTPSKVRLPHAGHRERASFIARSHLNWDSERNTLE